MTGMYDALGGRPALVRIVDGHNDRPMAGATVRHHFRPERLPSLEEAQVRWFAAVLQGEEPPGDLRDIHAHLEIADHEVEAVLGHLDARLGELGLDRRLHRAVVALISRLWHARQFCRQPAGTIGA